MPKPLNTTTKDWDLITLKYPKKIKWVLKKIKKKYPVQYLIGNVNFCGLNINVNQAVLIPRFETELLVEKCLNRLIDNEGLINILEIGTGSGCISISLAKKITADITATDISRRALKVAKANAIQNNVNINWQKQDIFKSDLKGHYDLIISNPPYVGKGEIVDLETTYEPKIALYAKNDGLAFYEEITKKAVNHLKPGGLIAFEIGKSQGIKVKKIVRKYFPHYKIEIEKDLTGKDRYVFISDNK